MGHGLRHHCRWNRIGKCFPVTLLKISPLLRVVLLEDVHIIGRLIVTHVFIQNGCFCDGREHHFVGDVGLFKDQLSVTFLGRGWGWDSRSRC